MEDMEGRKSKVFSVFQKLITFEVYFPVIKFVSTQLRPFSMHFM
jgi:hypothetical protein